VIIKLLPSQLPGLNCYFPGQIDHRVNSRKKVPEASGRELMRDTTIRVKRANIDWHHVEESGIGIL